MNIINTSQYPTPVVKALVRWTLAHMEGDHVGPRKPPRDVEVTNYSRGMRGTAWPGGRIMCRLGAPNIFPAKSFGGSLGYIGWEASNWMEALVGVVAHELNHIDQFRRGDRRGSMYKENECDREAIRVLEQFRSDRSSVDAIIAKAEEREARQRQKASSKDTVGFKIAHLQKMRDRWMRKMKLAKTKLRGLDRKMKYYIKKEGAMASPPSPTP